MKVLVLIDPIIRLFITKYQMFLAPPQAMSPILKNFLTNKLIFPKEVHFIIEVFSKILQQCIQENQFYRIAALRKYIGNGQNLKGLLNILEDKQAEIYLFVYEQNKIPQLHEQLITIKMNLQSFYIIAPLNLDENEEIYSYFHKQWNLPVFPYTFNFLASKWVKNFTFAPYATRAFFIPEGLNALDFLPKIQKIAETEKLNFLFLKDEFDFNSGAAVPYMISPIKNLEQFITIFNQKAKGVGNLGGLVMEEFLTQNNEISLYKIHTFGQIIEGEYIHYSVNLKDFQEGALYEKLIERVQEQTENISPEILKLLNPKIKSFYPMIFSSVDFILDNNIPKIIDLNSIAGSLGYCQQLDKTDGHNPFEFFLQHLPENFTSEQNQILCEQQIAYEKKIRKINDIIHELGPCYITGDSVIQLQNEKKLLIKEIIGND